MKSLDLTFIDICFIYYLCPMLFEDIPGHSFIKDYLINEVQREQVAHTQLFVGASGSGVLPLSIAYAQYLLCYDSATQGQQNTSCSLKCNKLIHPDLHFVYPVANSTTIKSHAISDSFAPQWREFVLEQSFSDLYIWYQKIDIEKKQGQIGVDEAKSISQKMSLKPYEADKKILLIWMAEKMNVAATNKLLKFIEEPPENTYLILIAEREEDILQTIRSRCQVLHLKKIPEQDIITHLETQQISTDKAKIIAHQCQGDLQKMQELVKGNVSDTIFGEWFVTWVRTAFSASGNKQSILPLISWSQEITKSGRETQKRFINYCANIFRQAFMKNYSIHELVYLESLEGGFQIEKFAPFIHSQNIAEIYKLLNDATYHIQRNANAKIIFTDLSISLTRILHHKES